MKKIKGWFVMIVSLSVLFGLASNVLASSATVVKSQVGITFLEGNSTEESTGAPTETVKESANSSVEKEKGKLPQTGEVVGEWGSLLGILLLLITGVLLYATDVLIKNREYN